MIIPTAEYSRLTRKQRRYVRKLMSRYYINDMNRNLTFMQWLCGSAVIPRNLHAKYIRRAINDLGYDKLCIQCGYQLIGLTDKKDLIRCPECGNNTMIFDYELPTDHKI